MAASDNIHEGQFNMFTGELDPVQHSAPLPEIAKREKQELKEQRKQSLKDENKDYYYHEITGQHRPKKDVFGDRFDRPIPPKDFVWTGPRLYHGSKTPIEGDVIHPTDDRQHLTDRMAFATTNPRKAASYTKNANDWHDRPALFDSVLEVEPLGPAERTHISKKNTIKAYQDYAEELGSKETIPEELIDARTGVEHMSRFGLKVVGHKDVRYDGKIMNEEPRERRSKPEGTAPDYDVVHLNGKTIPRQRFSKRLDAWDGNPLTSQIMNAGERVLRAAHRHEDALHEPLYKGQEQSTRRSLHSEVSREQALVDKAKSYHDLLYPEHEYPDERMRFDPSGLRYDISHLFPNYPSEEH